MRNRFLLPEWFDWKDYLELASIPKDDKGTWAYLFATRDPSLPESEFEMLQKTTILHPAVKATGIPRMLWSNGVLCFGMKGHETHIVMHSVKGYQSKKRLFAHTVELAINIRMPKDVLIQEISKLIDEKQNVGHEREYAFAEHDKKYMRKEPITFAKGLACWDIWTHYGSPKNAKRRIAEILMTEWRDRNGGDEVLEQSLSDVKESLKVVEPFIRGGWRLLTGDPLAKPPTVVTNRRKN
jgi:hypothetical protein